MDNYFRLDLTEVMRNIDMADVLTIYFPYIGKTLVLDLRFNVDQGPMIKLMPMVSSSEERFRSLRKLRPKFGKPTEMAAIPWPKYIRSLETLGLCDKILGRLAFTGYESAVHDFRVAFTELLRLERKEQVGAITGVGYQTIWESANKA